MRRGEIVVLVGLALTLALVAGALAGGGTIFKPPVEYPSDDGETFRVTKGDFDKDGRLDLAATNLETPIFSISVFLGKANGTFDDGVPFIGGGGSADIESGRFGNDPNPDMAITDSSDGVIEVYAGHGDGTFEFEKFESYAVSPGVFGIDAGKLDGDRWTDLAAADSTGGAWVMWAGRTEPSVPRSMSTWAMRTTTSSSPT